MPHICPILCVWPSMLTKNTCRQEILAMDLWQFASMKD